MPAEYPAALHVEIKALQMAVTSSLSCPIVSGASTSIQIPKGGAPAWFDLMVIPKDAPHPEEALAFINYIETPQVHAAITNTMFYPNANKEARKYVVKDVADNPMIYPSPEVSKTLYVIKAQPLNVQRLQTRMWAELKSGR